jgi:hypothetical protein
MMPEPGIKILVEGNTRDSMRFTGIGFAVAAAAWMGLIFYLSSLSGVSTGDENFHPIGAAAVYWQGGLRSYAGHIVLYGVLAALIQAILWGWNLGFRVRWSIIAALVSSLFGISDEYHQSFVFGREASGLDLLVDAVAATVSATLLWTLATSRARLAVQALIFRLTPYT